MDNPVSKESLNELQKQKNIDDREYNQKLTNDALRKLTWDNIVVDDEILIEKRTGEALSYLNLWQGKMLD